MRAFFTAFTKKDQLCSTPMLNFWLSHSIGLVVLLGPVQMRFSLLLHPLYVSLQLNDLSAVRKIEKIGDPRPTFSITYVPVIL